MVEWIHDYFPHQTLSLPSCFCLSFVIFSCDYTSANTKYFYRTCISLIPLPPLLLGRLLLSLTLSSLSTSLFLSSPQPQLIHGQILSIPLLLNLSTFLHSHCHHLRQNHHLLNGFFGTAHSMNSWPLWGTYCAKRLSFHPQGNSTA